jgi:hypothetical protein
VDSLVLHVASILAEVDPLVVELRDGLLMDHTVTL